jgi:putative acetyltransferase
VVIMTSGTQIEVRAVEPTDAADVHKIMSQPQAIRGTMATPYASLARRQKALSDIPSNALRLAAAMDRKVVGVAGLDRSELPRLNHTATLSIAMHDAYAGQGVGSALMGAIVEAADRWWNLVRLELEVYADNVRAIALYERFGFEREGLLRARAWRDGEYADCLSMARLRA